MSVHLTEFEKQQLPDHEREQSKFDVSEFNDPFTINNFVGAVIYVGSKYNHAGGVSASIEFVNKNTIGQQKFYANNLQELLYKIKVFTDNLNK